MAKVVTLGIQKGGCGKTTSTAIMSYLLAKEGKRVLVVDMDSQGNLTDLMTEMSPEEYEGETVLEAIKTLNAKPYILEATENIHVLPSDDYLSTLARYLYLEYYQEDKNIAGALRKALDPIRDEYDYILIDTPPSLGEAMTNAICASDYVIVLVEAGQWAFTAIPRFLETVQYAQESQNPDLQVSGILRSMTDARRSDNKAYVELIAEEYPEYVFNTVIRRKAKTGRIPIYGFSDNKELKGAISGYNKFYKEFKERIG